LGSNEEDHILEQIELNQRKSGLNYFEIDKELLKMKNKENDVKEKEKNIDNDLYLNDKDKSDKV